MTTDPPDIPCSAAVLHRPHTPHVWEPQPGMDPAQCAGFRLTRVEIDPNIRARGGQARAGFEDADGPLQPGQTVEVYESETSLTGTGTVTAINTSKRLAWIAVEWPELRTSDRTETGVTIATAQVGGGAAEDRSGDGTPADPALREAIAGAVWSADEGGFHETTVQRVTTAVLAVIQPALDELADYRNRINWETNCGEHARLLDSSYDETMRREAAEAEVRRLTEELSGARATLDHMSKAMSWISGHDRQGLDHLEEAQHEARSRDAAVRQAQRWAGRARTAEALVIAQREVIERQAREVLAATTEPGTPRARRRTVAPTTDQPGDGGGQ